jgi:inner membrane protein
MEPVTHLLTGACIGRAGLNRKTAYATLAAVLAAEAPDLDILWGLAGPVEELKHHRGITHTFIAVPVIAAVVMGAVWVVHRLSKKLNRKAKAIAAQRTALPGVKWGWIYLTAVISLLSHLLLDWTNNYGLRPFYPFNPRWYVGSLIFIVEPVFWVVLILALVVPWLLGLADREIGARRRPFRGRDWAIFALVGMVVLGCMRWTEKGQARAMIDNTQVAAEPVVRMVLEPYPVNPFHWHAILETADFYQTAEVNTWTGSIVSNPRSDVMYKPTVTQAVEAAKQTFLGRVYLDWGRWAVVRDVGQEPVAGMKPPELPPGQTWTTVEFSDLRFAYSFLDAEQRLDRSPLSGWVYIVDGHEDAGEVMSGREQK